MKINIIDDLKCPTCGHSEMHPTEDWLIIRAFKVQNAGKWYSQCLYCAGYYNEQLQIQEDKYQRDKGWFTLG